MLVLTFVECCLWRSLGSVCYALWFVVCCSVLCVVCGLLVVRCVLFVVVRYVSLFVVCCCLWFVVRWLPPFASVVVRCPLFVV